MDPGDREGAPPRVAERVAGMPVTVGRPSAWQLHTATRIALDVAARQPDLWLLHEPELHLDEDVLVPDIAAWSREALPDLPDLPAFDLPPEWVCEVLSPATAATDRVGKMERYARSGVAHVWLVDPAHRTVEVFRLEGPLWRIVGLHQGEETAVLPPFGEEPFRLADWWAA